MQSSRSTLFSSQAQQAKGKTAMLDEENMIKKLENNPNNNNNNYIFTLTLKK